MAYYYMNLLLVGSLDRGDTSNTTKLVVISHTLDDYGHFPVKTNACLFETRTLYIENTNQIASSMAHIPWVYIRGRQNKSHRFQPLTL